MNHEANLHKIYDNSQVGTFLKFANLQIFAELYYVVPYEAAGELRKVEMLSFGQCSGEENANYQKI